jgi:hypothetical protein
MIRKIAFLACLYAISSNAFAATLSDFHFGYGGGWNIITETGYLRMAIGPDGSFLPSEYFSIATLTEDDSGLVFSITGEAFDHFNSYLTNGNDDYVGFVLCRQAVGGSCSGFASRESSRLGGDPDFFGSEITELQVRLNSISFETPAHDPNGDGVWTNYDYDMNFIISGSKVPVPAAAWLFGSGLGLLGWLRRRPTA